MTRTRAEQDQLDLDVAGLPQRGVLYADVNKQVAALVKAGKVDKDLHAGSIQQARSLAAAIDRASGLAGRKQETYALAGLHKQLHEILEALAGRTSDGAGLLELLKALDAADQE